MSQRESLYLPAFSLASLAAFLVAAAATEAFCAAAIWSDMSDTFFLARLCVPSRFLANRQARFWGLVPPPLRISMIRFS